MTHLIDLCLWSQGAMDAPLAPLESAPSTSPSNKSRQSKFKPCILPVKKRAGETLQLRQVDSTQNHTDSMEIAICPVRRPYLGHTSECIEHIKVRIFGHETRTFHIWTMKEAKSKWNRKKKLPGSLQVSALSQPQEVQQPPDRWKLLIEVLFVVHTARRFFNRHDPRATFTEKWCNIQNILLCSSNRTCFMADRL